MVLTIIYSLDFRVSSAFFGQNPENFPWIEPRLPCLSWACRMELVPKVRSRRANPLPALSLCPRCLPQRSYWGDSAILPVNFLPEGSCILHFELPLAPVAAELLLIVSFTHHHSWSIIVYMKNSRLLPKDSQHSITIPSLCAGEKHERH